MILRIGIFVIYEIMESTISSASRRPDSLSNGRGFESHQGHGDVSLSMSLHLQKNIMKMLKDRY